MSNDITSRLTADYEAYLRSRLDARAEAIEECAREIEAVGESLDSETAAYAKVFTEVVRSLKDYK